MKTITSKFIGTVGVGIVGSALLVAAADATIFRCFTNPSVVDIVKYTKSGSNGSAALNNYEIVSACSTTSGTLGSIQRAINRDGYYGAGASYCWCRIVRPVAGVWVCTPVSGSCAANCMSECARKAAETSLINKFFTPAS